MFSFFKDFIPCNQRLLDGSQFSFSNQNSLNSGNNRFPTSVTVKCPFYNGTMYGQNLSILSKSQVSLVIQKLIRFNDKSCLKFYYLFIYLFINVF